MSVMYMLEERVFVNWFFFNECIIFLWSYQLCLDYSILFPHFADAYLSYWRCYWNIWRLLPIFLYLRLRHLRQMEALVVLWIWSKVVSLLRVYFPMLYTLEFYFSPLWPLPSLIILLFSLMYHLSYLPFSSEFFFCKNSFTVILNRE